MTQVWKNEVVIPVTKVKLEPGVVIDVKNQIKDGYNAVIVGFGTRKEKNINKPQLGQTKGLGKFRYLKEFRYNLEGKAPIDKKEFENLKRGDKIGISTFELGDIVEVQGTSKGKGFQGGVKRHGFHGQDTTHGTKDQVRMPGSVGAGEPQHVFKGLRMAGRMGNAKTTIKNLEVIEINLEENILSIKGAVPGARNGVLCILGKGELKTIKSEEKLEAPVREKEEKKEEKTAKEEVPEKVEEVKKELKEEAKKEEVKEETKEEVKKEEVKELSVEEKKDEPVAEEKKEEVKESVKVVPEKVEENEVYKFNHLPKHEKEKYSTPEIMKAVMELEEKYKVDLIPVITKVVVKELNIDELDKYFINEIKLEEPKAAEIAKEIKEKIFK